MNYMIIGNVGTGKTTLANIVSKQTNYKIYDDLTFESYKTGKPIQIHKGISVLLPRGFEITLDNNVLMFTGIDEDAKYRLSKEISKISNYSFQMIFDSFTKLNDEFRKYSYKEIKYRPCLTITKNDIAMNYYSPTKFKNFKYMRSLN